MVHPDKVGIEAKKKEDENFKFRSFLKGHADEEELDEQFLRLHKELFANYDCSKCRNCCKMYKGSIPKEDVESGIIRNMSLVIFCRKMETVNLGTVNRIVVRNILIQTSRKDCVVCWGC